MPNFRYRARDRSGKLVKGIIAGENQKAVARSLEGVGYIPISIAEAAKSVVPQFSSRFAKVGLTDLNMFTRQLLTLQKAGLPLLTSLGTIEKQLKNQHLRDVVREVSSTIEGGSSLSDAMEKHPGVFNELYVNMVRAGEAGGTLDEILERLADLGEKELDTRNRIKAATRYPMIASIALCIAFVVVVTFVIPKFSAVYAQYKTALPLPTRMLLALGSFLKERWYVMAAALAGLFFGFRYFIRTPKGRYAWDTVKLKTPVFGPILLMLTMSRLTRIMAILIRSGLPILQILDMVARTVDNAVLSKAIGTITESVRQGQGLTEPMRLAGIFPPIVLQMVSVGEETGKLDELLYKVSDYFDQQSDYNIKNLTVLIEPLFVVVLGVMVLIMALAIFLPMWNLTALFRH